MSKINETLPRSMSISSFICGEIERGYMRIINKECPIFYSTIGEWKHYVDGLNRKEKMRFSEQLTKLSNLGKKEVFITI